MAIVGINPVQRPPAKKDTLDKIAAGLDIAQSILGIGLAIPKAIQDRRESRSKIQTDKDVAEGRKLEQAIGIATKTRPITGSEVADPVLAKAGLAGRIARRPDIDPLKQAKIQDLAPVSQFPELQNALSGIDPSLAKIPNLTVGQASRMLLDRAASASDPKAQLAAKLTSLSIKEKERKLEDRPKELSQATIRVLDEGNAIPNQLDSIEDTIEQNIEMFGPVGGRIRQLNVYDPAAQTVDAKMRATSQAFGRFMEGGVLRKEDEEKYRRMFPNLGDLPETAKGKLQVIRDLLQQKQKSMLESFKAQGFDVQGLEREQPREEGTKKGDIDLDGQISQAEKWVMDNPDDPRVPDVIKSIKARKGQ